MTALQQYSRVARRRLIDRAKSTGLFRDVLGYESVSELPDPGGLYALVVNGPGSVSRVTLKAAVVAESYWVHVLRSLPLGEAADQEQVDPAVSDARDTLLLALCQPIGYGAEVFLDVGGSEGTPLAYEPGYLDIGTTKYRTETITVPFVVFNAWEITNS